MDDLPELPFEKVLGYLSLEERLKARAVSRKWYVVINRLKVKSLCFSFHQRDHILGKQRWVSGAFAQNFINAPRFATFFDTFGQTILSALKHLRLCDLDLYEEERQAAFVRILHSFPQLEELDIIRTEADPKGVMVNLNLPTLTSIQLDTVDSIEKLTLDAARLRMISSLDCCVDLNIIHGESVVKLVVDELKYTEVKNLKNLQSLYVKDLSPDVDPTFLSDLQKLKEFHTNDFRNVSKLFDQKQRSGRTNPKIYLGGLLLNGPDDPAIIALQDTTTSYLDQEWLDLLAENRSRLADQMLFYQFFGYCGEDDDIPGPGMDLLKRFTNLNEFKVGGTVQDIQSFLGLLKNCENIVELVLDQSQALFDQLSEHCAVQKLTLHCPPSDLAFLFRLKHLIHLSVGWSIGSETVRRAFDELPALSYLAFEHDKKRFSIDFDQLLKVFTISHGIGYGYRRKHVSDLNVAIEYVFGKEKPSSPKKRKTDEEPLK